MRTSPIAPQHDLGGSTARAFPIPFLPFDIEPFRIGAASFDGSNRSEGKPEWDAEILSIRSAK